MLDACIATISSYLSGEEKVRLLLDAIQQVLLDHDRIKDTQIRAAIEHAAESCLCASKNPVQLVQARILCAKSRLAGGFTLGACQDLQAALSIDSDDQAAKALLKIACEPGNRLRNQICTSSGNGVFSPEIWLEITNHLSRYDLRSLLFVPYIPSRIARQVLFRRIDLYFTDLNDGNENRHEELALAKRNVDLLTHLIVDHHFARLVVSLRIFCNSRVVKGSMVYPAGILALAVPKLVNLREVYFSQDQHLFLDIFRHVSNQLRRLSFSVVHSDNDLLISEFRHLTHMSCDFNRHTALKVVPINRPAAQWVKLHDFFMPMRLPYLTGMHNLKHLDIGTSFDDEEPFCRLFLDFNQLEFLAIKCFLKCKLASRLRRLTNCLPFVEHFSMSEIHTEVNDPDFFPAMVELLRNRTGLKSLLLGAPVDSPIKVGYEASVWGILPSLVNLNSLCMDFPPGLSPSLASWLIPRSVRSLSLYATAFPQTNVTSYLKPFQAGVPPGLRFVRFHLIEQVKATVLLKIFPMVKVLSMDDKYWKVSGNVDGTLKQLEECPKAIVDRHLSEWLRHNGCEDIWLGEFDC